MGGVAIPQVSCCKYLGVILRQDLGWGEHVTSIARKAWKSLHFIMRTLKNANMESRKMGYTSLVRPILEYASAGWDPYRLGQIEELEKIQKKANKFINKGYSASSNPPEPIESLSVRRKKARLCCLFKAYSKSPAWAEITKRLGSPSRVGRNDHTCKIKSRGQRSDVGKYSYVNRTIKNWNEIPAAVVEPFPGSVGVFRRRLNQYM